MSKISAHVLDTALGRPARELMLRIDVLEEGTFRNLGSDRTNADGRASDLLHGRALESGTYRVVFDTEPYLRATGQNVFYPYVEIVFSVTDASEHYHIPLLLSPYGYSTYRGS
ncbi:MAG TPA: hydroxyisourate hydrolase [Polyangiales bacterium]|nr:hydroxyisourate hydrolase [Polyangiales bacterium]